MVVEWPGFRVSLKAVKLASFGAHAKEQVPRVMAGRVV
jgi:hypothetical protein